MARTKSFNLRFSEEELEKLKAYAKSKEISPAEVLREYVKRLLNVFCNPRLQHASYFLHLPLSRLRHCSEECRQ